MKSFLYNILSKSKITLLKTRKTELHALMFDIIDKYYNQLSQKKLHQDTIVFILKEFFHNESHIKEAKKFIFSSKNETDRSFEQKFGKKGKYMAELHKLIQIVYYIKNDISPKNDIKTTKVRSKINQDFNKITLHFYDKYEK
jgi:hypothetical protein